MNASILRLTRALLLIGVCCVSSLVQSEEHALASKALPRTDSLPNALAQALIKKEPLLVMVSLEGCPYCKTVRESYLIPLLSEHVQVVQINMSDAHPIKDFDGAVMTQNDWVLKYRVKMAPTVLFFAQNGLEVAPRLRGAYLSDFYGAYLDQNLSTARQRVLKGF